MPPGQARGRGMGESSSCHVRALEGKVPPHRARAPGGGKAPSSCARAPDGGEVPSDRVRAPGGGEAPSATPTMSMSVRLEYRHRHNVRSSYNEKSNLASKKGLNFFIY